MLVILFFPGPFLISLLLIQIDVTPEFEVTIHKQDPDYTLPEKGRENGGSTSRTPGVVFRVKPYPTNWMWSTRKPLNESQNLKYVDCKDKGRTVTVVYDVRWNACVSNRSFQ